MSAGQDNDYQADKYSFWSSGKPDTEPVDLSEEENKIQEPYTAGNSNQVDLRSRSFVSPLTQCHSYIDIKDIDSPDWKISGGWPSDYKRLELLNRGIYNGKWANQTLKRGQDDWYMCQNIACQLGMSEKEKAELWSIYEDLDMRSFKKYETDPQPKGDNQQSWIETEEYAIHPSPTGNRKQYVVIFCLCALLYNRDRSDNQPRFYPDTEYESRTRYGVGCQFVRNLIDHDMHDGHELLQQFAEKLQFREENIRSCMEKLRQDCSSL